ncbi:protein SLOW WALKER 2 [Aegilops tauschii subsp. strangulata]|uniref:CCAAT-binding factor domain-containing protein n=5 Tax=Aegilops tauschii subsp. strangulata TaxID=200361 RepID=A0A453P0J0_AEGTS|nr:CCAAT/enhancer-binding protein zeta [Aegilops tauschii subsp. strangulata]
MTELNPKPKSAKKARKAAAGGEEKGMDALKSDVIPKLKSSKKSKKPAAEEGEDKGADVLKSDVSPEPKSTKKKKKKKKSAAGGEEDDIDAIKSDVASFASSLGLVPGAGNSSGFDDSDFRKSGPMSAPKPPKHPQTPEAPANTEPPQNPKPTKKPHPLELHGPRTAATTSATTSATTNYPLVKAGALSGQWYADAAELEARVLGDRKHAAPAVGLQEMQRMVERKRELAEKLMAQYSREYDSVRRGTGDLKLLEMSAKSGTSADKVSAFTCLVEDNPIANMRALDSLLGMVASKVGKRYAFTGFDALRELFEMRLLPDRKLKSLIQRPLDILPETKDGYSLLLFWHWEDCLKQRYEKFVIALEVALKDMLPSLKDKAMKTVSALLKSKSEQERRLLTALVNKLGDPERRAASSAAYLLTGLLSTHPNMKMVVIDEVDSFLFRPHVGLRAKYQAVNFLSHIFLTSKGDGPKIAKRLVDVYIAVFKVLMSCPRDSKGEKQSKHGKKKVENGKTKGREDKVNDSNSHGNHEMDPPAGTDLEMDSRLLSALLSGVNRALPYVASSEVDDIVEVQTPILFRLVHSENFNVGVQALMLLYQISTKNQIASDRFYRALYAKLLSPSAVSSSKPELFLGLLVKAMKNDVMLKRVAAFSKRLLQVALQRPPQYACGCLFILSEVLKTKPPLWTIVLQNESVDDGIEHFEDIVENPEDPAIASTSPIKQDSMLASLEKYNSDGEDDSDATKQVKVSASDENGQTNASAEGSTSHVLYNPRHREPSYCNADRASWWELTLLASHVHPSVFTMARTLLSGNNIVYNGDPLTDLSLPAFLDKFMEKKPKGNRIAEGKWHGGSQIAPAKKLDLNHHLIGQDLLELAENEVPPEDVVFHRFYMNKTGPIKPKAKKKASVLDEDTGELLADDVDDGSDESDDEMQELDESDDEMQELEDESAEDGEYDYDNLDAKAFEEEGDLLRDDSDADVLDDISDDDEDDDEDDGLNLSYVDESADDSDDDVTDVKAAAAARGQKRKSRSTPFASLEEYEHLMEGEAEKSTLKKQQRKHKEAGDSMGRKERGQKQSGSRKRKSQEI